MSDQHRGRRRPGGVVCAATLQLLTAIPFVLGISTVLLFGADAQAAAEAEIVRQGLPAATLAQNGISFRGDEKLAILIVAILVILAWLNLAGRRIGRILSLIFQPILFVLGVVIIPGQLFTAQLLESIFKSSGDAALARIDVPALVEAAMSVMPGWLIPADVTKLVLTTVGSVVVVILLLVPSARAYFRKAEPASAGSHTR